MNCLFISFGRGKKVTLTTLKSKQLYLKRILSSKLKRQVTNWKKIVATYIIDPRLLTTVCKEHLQISRI